MFHIIPLGKCKWIQMVVFRVNRPSEDVAMSWNEQIAITNELDARLLAWIWSRSLKSTCWRCFDSKIAVSCPRITNPWTGEKTECAIIRGNTHPVCYLINFWTQGECFGHKWLILLGFRSKYRSKRLWKFETIQKETGWNVRYFFLGVIPKVQFCFNL